MSRRAGAMSHQACTKKLHGNEGRTAASATDAISFVAPNACEMVDGDLSPTGWLAVSEHRHRQRVLEPSTTTRLQRRLTLLKLIFILAVISTKRLANLGWKR